MLPTSVARGPTGPNQAGGDKRKGEFSCFSQDEAEQRAVQDKIRPFPPPPPNKKK